MERLPEAAWTAREDLAQLVAALGEADVRWVGGAVRDTLLGHPVADIDAATRLVPQEVMQRLESASISVVPTGLQHGTVTAILPLGNVEVTTLRRDVATDGRRAVVAFADDWREDAARRDFTINALYAHPGTLALDDYFNGLQDLAQRRVRFIGAAEQRIREDHLRILRYYRFQTRFGAELDADAEDACAALASTLKGLSRERVAMELLNLLALPDPHETIARMFARGVLGVVLPETGPREIDALNRLVRAETTRNVPPVALRRLGALLPADRACAQAVAARLRLSSAQKKRLVSMASRSFTVQDARALAYRIGRDEAIDRLLLNDKEIAPLAAWEKPHFPLKGGAIVARGIGAGPEVARILQAVEARWVEEGFPSRNRVQEMLDQELEQ